MNQYLGRRLLVSVGDNDAPRQTCVMNISPNKRYVLLGGITCNDEQIGWAAVVDVRVLDDLGPADWTESMMAALAAAMHKS